MTGATPVSPNPVSQPPVATAIGNPFSRPLVSPPNSPDAPGEISVATEIPVATLRTPKDPTEPIGIRRRVFRFIGWSIRGLFCIASLIALLAVLSAIPIFQLIAFGYLLDVAGRLTRGAKFRDSLPNLQRAGTIGLAATAIFVASLPTQLLVHWESVAQLIDPGSLQATLLRVLAFACSFAAMGYLLWAWVRGGQLRHYLWPQPKRFLREGWRPGTWSTIPDRLWDFTVALELPRLFWLGTRGAVATLIWLVPGMIIIAMNRNGETPVAGLIGGLALIAMGGVLLYLPMLQAHFAAENRLGAMFELRRIRQDFRRAPWAWLLAMIFGLVILPIPLYLLKIEATPREVLWLPCVVFVGFILPARVGEGLALRRARRRPDPSGLWAGISIWSVRVLMLAVVGTYLIFLTVSQFTSWDGLPTWVEQHAILFPRPFIGGV
ncbi:MAG: DUF4013 domain-containing protein [Pirellulaceae bacterium]|nr:DUF4013 domain-containing protein [Pirellulaceae bacterium]